MELIFKWLNILFFKYLERLNLRVFVKSASFETLGLLHVQSNFSSLFKKLSSNHPELGKDFPKLSANIDVSCLFRYSLPLFKQDASMLVLSILFKRLLKQHFWSLSLTATISSFLLTLPRPIIEEKPNLNFLSLSISSTVATTFRTLVKVFISFFKSFVPEWKNKKIQFLLNTWLDIINNIFNCCTRIGFVLIFALFFLEIPEPVKCLTIESLNMMTLVSVDTELGFDLFVVVFCSGLFVELVLFLFISCILFYIFLSVEVESWMASDERSQIDLNKLLIDCLLFIFKLLT